MSLTKGIESDIEYLVKELELFYDKVKKENNDDIVEKYEDLYSSAYSLVDSVESLVRRLRKII